MKFHCDRCKTRYSIADERVRGKILKIRCKNCSAVITVREGMDAAAPRKPAAKAASRSGPVPSPARPAAAAPPVPSAPAAPGSALRGAFEQVMDPGSGGIASPSASDSFAAPAQLEEEWYVSIDGAQEGPFSLAEAQAWVSARRPDDELYCWSEGFDDWLPTEKVSHFRGLRQRPDTLPSPRAPSAAGMAAAPSHPEMQQPAARIPAREETPKPLFAATLAALEKETSTDLPPSPEGAPSNGSSGRAHGMAPFGLPEPSDGAGEDEATRLDAPPVEGDLPEPEGDLEIGEVSRIVKLPNLLAMRNAGGAAPAARPDGGLPGLDGGAGQFGRGTGSQPAMAGGAAPGASGAALDPLSDAALAGASPQILTSAPPSQRRVGTVPMLIAAAAMLVVVGGALLFVLLSDGDSGAVSQGTIDDDTGDLAKLGYRFESRRPQPNERRTTLSDDDDDEGETRTTNINRRPPSNRNGDRGTTETTGGRGDDGGKTEAVISSGGNENLKPLTPNDILRVSSSKQFTTRRCYERALKKNPFLEVSRILVDLEVNAAGVVTSVRLSAKSDEFLGQCLIASIRKWQFRRSTKGIVSQFPIVFEQR